MPEITKELATIYGIDGNVTVSVRYGGQDAIVRLSLRDPSGDERGTVTLEYADASTLAGMIGRAARHVLSSIARGAP